MTDIKNDRHAQAEIFAQKMKRLREIEWLESRLIEISGRRGYEAEEEEITAKLRELRNSDSAACRE